MTTPDLRPGRSHRPYRDLHIYYLNGRLTGGHRDLGPGFIGNWEEQDTSFLFFSRPSDDTVQRLVAETGPLTLIDTFHLRYDEWQGGQMPAISVGRYRIMAPWTPPDQVEPETDAIWLDPGVVFGAGTHATTSDCLAALDRLLKNRRVDTVLDLGTGSGVLAVFAAMAGCRRILAVDLNFLAVQTTARNVALNGLQPHVLALQGKAEDFIDVPADLVVANIHHAVMAPLIDSQGFAQKKWFLLSGLMRREAKRIERRLRQKGADILQTWSADGIWFTFIGKNR